jgi:NAD(P)-dependent dehydrogenase (short-subunit alcohol dehydrogenase family)
MNRGDGVYPARKKAAVRAFVRTWAQEFKGRNIRINSLSPGAADTPIIDGQFDSAEKAGAARGVFAAATALGRPEEPASAALFLASDDSSYITGIELQVDGGFAQV